MMQNALLNKDQITEFKKLIENYQPNREALGIFLKSNFVVIAGPAGAGKDTLRNSLIQKYSEDYLPILSSTTRPMREGEKDRIDYHFISVEEMKQELEKQEFLQAALVHNQQISAMHVNEIKKLSAGQTGLSILIVQTEKELRILNPGIRTVFLVPPSRDELIKRLNYKRQLSNEEQTRRLLAAKKELQIALDEPSYYCVISDGEEETAETVHAFLQKGPKATLDLAARQKAAELLASLKKELPVV